MTGGAGTGDSGFVGGFVGYNSGATAVVSNSTASGTVSAGAGASVGGFAGFDGGDGMINSSASGNVTDTSTAYIGGFVGDEQTSIANTTNDFATGNVTGGAQSSVGGFVGLNDGRSRIFCYGSSLGWKRSYTGGFVGQGQSITNSYALGAVTGGTNASVGGFGGYYSGSVSNSFSAGSVSGGAGSSVGGFMGTIAGAYDASASYWDVQTSGVSQGVGNIPSTAGTITGVTTAQLQAALDSTWSTGVWGIVSGISFPYLNWQVSGTPQVIAGTIANGATPVSGVPVAVLVNGVPIAPLVTMTAAANGYYYFLLSPGTIGLGSDLLASVTGGNAGVTFADGVAGSVGNLNILSSYMSEVTSDSLYSVLSSNLTSAINGNSALQSLIASLPNTAIQANGSSFTIDQAISPGALILSTAGSVTQSAPITTGSLALLGGGASYALTNSSNSIGTLAANTAR